VDTKDPTTVSLYYLALHKQSTLKKLFETKQNFKVAEFFGRDFKDPKNKIACEKNSYVLLGRHEYGNYFIYLKVERIRSVLLSFVRSN
jgi:hypothetical protein